jgi:hypothetical protein
MSLVKHNNNSISDITSAGSLAQGKMTLISSQTASGSASIEFTSGIDSTYPIYKFEFINIHPQTDSVDLQFNLSTDGGSNYNVTKTTTFFRAYHNESGSTSNLRYETGSDLAQGTGFQGLNNSEIGNDNDQSCVGTLHLFNPSSTTFVKHFIATTNTYHYEDYSFNSFIAGYGNTTSAVDAIKFQMSSGNIDSGTIKLYGIGE